MQFLGAGLPQLAQSRDEDVLRRRAFVAARLPLLAAAVAVEAHGRGLDDEAWLVRMALEPLGDLLGRALAAGQQRALAGSVPAAFAHRGAGQVDEQVGLDAGVEVGQCGQGLDAGAELVAGLVREAGDDDDAPVLLREITGQMAADETAAAQKDDDGLLFHESFLAWTDRPLPSINVSILSPNMVDCPA